MKWIEVFKTGKHKAKDGTVKNYTADDLDQIASKYNSQKAHEAPIVIGHPKTNDPAFGWVEQLKRKGELLLALPKQIAPEFQEAVEKGFFKKRSIALYPDGLLRHVGFLGAVPPAVKGLADVQFSSEDLETIVLEYGESESEGANAELEKLQVQVKAQEDKIKLLEGELSKSTTNFQEAVDAAKLAEDNLKELNLKTRTLEYKTFLNERIAYGNLTPKQLDSALKILEALDSLELKDSEGHSVFEFSDNTEANPTKLFQEFLSSYPKFVEFSEIAVSRQEKENNKENKSQSEIVADEIRKQMSEKTI